MILLFLKLGEKYFFKVYLQKFKNILKEIYKNTLKMHLN
jgi:hypothetical protein